MTNEIVLSLKALISFKKYYICLSLRTAKCCYLSPQFNDQIGFYFALYVKCYRAAMNNSLKGFLHWQYLTKLS